MRNYLPSIMSCLLISAIGLVLFLRLAHQGELSLNHLIQPATILGLFYVLWVLAESHVSLDEPKKGSAHLERPSALLYPLSQGAIVLTALWFGSDGPVLRGAFGFSLFFAGVFFRLYAIRTLGRYYSHMVRIQHQHHIVDTGPYRFIRHPAYTGMILSQIGILVAFYNPITLAVLCVGLIPAIILRIRHEEHNLSAVPGYLDFSKTRKRLLPMIW